MSEILGNTKMVHYGIQNEKVDLRAHVGVNTRRVYVFTPEAGTKATESGTYIGRPVYTGNIVTAYGYAVPWDEVEGCRWFDIPDDVMTMAGFRLNMGTSEKGKRAEFVVIEMVRRGIIPLMLDVVRNEDFDSQLLGSDVLVRLAKDIQSKCDWRCGHRELGGTGRLYLQTKECNPLRQF